MENLLSRYRNVSILVGVLFLQVLGLAVQVRRNADDESSRLIRIWAVGAISPVEKGISGLQHGSGNLWREYVYLRGVRQENRDLKMEIERLKLERVRLGEDAEQARRLQALLNFKEQFISKTVAAQVIGASGSAQSRLVYIDKGSENGVRPDMAVITAEGVVGKVLRVFGSTAQVLLINDQSSGVGAILEKSRLQGVLRGIPSGDVILDKILAEETVEAGEMLRTSGGDQIFPKGMPVGTVTKVSRTPEAFLKIEVKPAANLGKLEEVLVIVEKEERLPAVAGDSAARAADILARRLPSVPEKPTDPNATPATDPNRPGAKPDTAKPDAAVTKPKPQIQQESAPGAANSGAAPSKPAQKPAVIKVSESPAPPPAKPKPATTEPAIEEEKPH